MNEDKNALEGVFIIEAVAYLSTHLLRGGSKFNTYNIYCTHITSYFIYGVGEKLIMIWDNPALRRHVRIFLL